MISRTFSNILSFFRKKFWFFLLLGAFFFFQTQGVFANTTQTGISAEDSQTLIGYLNGFMQIAASLLGLITGFISIFLYPGWVNGTLFGLQDYLKIMWVLVSNVVYFIFAGILIAIAFMNIIGKGEGLWELKSAMPKFIVGVLIVPFSWFFVQFLLSLSAILTVGVLTLPYDSFQNEELFSAVIQNEDENAIVNQKFCKSIVISLTGTFPEGAESVTENDGGTFPEQIKCKSEDDKVSIKEIISGEGGGAGLDNNVFGIISVYTYGILKVQERDTLTGADLTTVKGVMDLAFKVIFDLLFVVVYMILMVALFLALMSRGIHLWVYMMLSPLFGLLYFLGKGSEGFGGESKFNIKEFIALAMVPVYVAAALAFGLVFIMVASEGLKEKSSKDDLDTIEAGGFSLSIIGAHGDGEEEKSVIAKLIVQLFGVVILWIAVTAALKSSHVTSTVTQPIQDFGKSVGELVQKSPTYLPILPASLGGSAAGLGQMGQTISSSIQQSMNSKGLDAAKPFMPGNTADTAASGMKAQQLTDRLRSGVPPTNPLNLKELREVVKDLGSVEAISQNQQAVDALQEYLKQSGSTEIVKKGDVTSVSKAIGYLDDKYQRYDDGIVGGRLSSSSTKGEVDAAISKGIPETPPVGDTTNTFNLNASIVNDAIKTDGTVDTTKINAVKTAIGTDNLISNNLEAIKTKLSELIDESDITKKQEKVDALVQALGL